MEEDAAIRDAAHEHGRLPLNIALLSLVLPRHRYVYARCDIWVWKRRAQPLTDPVRCLALNPVHRLTQTMKTTTDRSRFSIILRLLRVMRVFRIFKLGRYTVGGELLQVGGLTCDC